MAARRFAPARVQRRPVRNYAWGGISIPQTVIPVETKVILGSFILSTQFDETVVRVRGQLVCISDQIGTLEAASAAIGMIIVSEDAFAAGIGSVPGPVSDIGNDEWFMWQPLSSYFDLIAGGDPLFQTIDSKAKRIVREGSRVAVVAEGAASPEVTAMRFSGHLRVLSLFRS